MPVRADRRASSGLGALRRLANPLAVAWVAVSAALGLASTQPASAAGSERALVRDAGFADGEVGYVVYDPQAGRIVRSHLADRPFIPASMVKIATALVALQVLGPDHRFRTTVYGQPADGGLHLHLSGGGDPVLVQEEVEALAAALSARVAGRTVTRFTFDDAALPFVPRIDPSDDGLKPYNPPVSALSVNFNRQWLRWSRDGDSRAMLVSLRPDFGHAVAGLSARPAADGRAIQALDRGQTVYLLTPRVPSSGHRAIAVRMPAMRTAAMLQAYADRFGLDLPPPEERPLPPAGAQVLASHVSRPLVEIVQAVLEYSNNLSAELIGLAAAQALQPEVGSLADAAAAVRQWLGRAVPQAVVDAWQIPNQSGLSGAARASPRELMALLRYGAGQRYAVPAETGIVLAGGVDAPVPFPALLPEPRWAAEDGLAVRAKSGTMYYTRGEAGVLTAASGRPMLFVLMHTDFRERARYEAEPERFSAPVQRRARQWLDRARRLERQILRYWVVAF